VVEVAIVRPGPISGGMVHPYLKARERAAKGEEIEYERSRYEPKDKPPRLQKALERTLGIPIFQEQVMEISMVAAGFSGRRGRWPAPRHGRLEAHRQHDPSWRERLIGGMLANGYSELCRTHLRAGQGLCRLRLPGKPCLQLCAAGLRKQLAQMPRARMLPGGHAQFAAHGVLPPVAADPGRRAPRRAGAAPRRVAQRLGHSIANRIGVRFQFFFQLPFAVRLGLRLVGSLSAGAGQRIEAARAEAAFTSTEDLSLRAQLDVRDLNALAAGDALKSLVGHRRQQVWDAAARHRAPALLRGAPVNEEALELPGAARGRRDRFDYASLGLTLRRHPLALLRERLARKEF
jgi:error-prone DNA polymerase